MKNMGLLFTRGVSLQLWVERGMFDREKKIYELLISAGETDIVYWFTYGSKDRKIYQDLLENKKISPKIQVISKPAIFDIYFGNTLYSLLLPMLKKKYLKKLALIKTNQMDGGWTALAIKKKYGIPLFFRTGYTLSKLWQEGDQSQFSTFRRFIRKIQLPFYKRVEKRLYQNCDVAAVSSRHDKEYICKQYCIDMQKIRIIPNYIDTGQFYDIEQSQREERFIFVGRLSQEKNLFNAIRAVNEAGYGIDLYGYGSLYNELQNFIDKNKYDAKLMGSIPNGELPQIYRKYKFFILVSPFEGMPKTLLEAMACGLVCVGVNSSGMKEVICDGVDGFLADSCSTEDIATVVKKIIKIDTEEVRKKAVEKIEGQYSLESVFCLERSLIRDMCNTN